MLISIWWEIQILTLQVLTSVSKGCLITDLWSLRWGSSWSHDLFWVSLLGTTSLLHSFIYTKGSASSPGESWLVALKHWKILQALSVPCLFIVYYYIDTAWHKFVPGYANSAVVGLALVLGNAYIGGEGLHVRHVFESQSTPILIVPGFNIAVTVCWKTDVYILTNTSTWKFPSKLREEANLFLVCVHAFQHREQQC